MKHLVITAHGIRTFGDWQERLEALLRQAPPSAADETLEVFHYKYGWFSVIAFLIPFSRWLVVRRFRKEFLKRANSVKWDRIDLVGHSFGTHLIGWSIYGIPTDERPEIHTIIMAGSVLKPTFPWLDLIGSSVRRLINDCGIHDNVLLLNQIVVLFTGMAGRAGFAGMTGSTFRNRYFSFGHSGYFQSSSGGDNSFMEEKWVPLLMQEAPIAVFPDPRRASAVSGVVAFVLNNLEPIKLAVYVSPLIALLLVYTSLYSRERSAVLGEQSQRQIAVTNEGIAKAKEKEANEQRDIAERKQKEADQERDRALEALANTHLREGLNSLTKPETSAEGLAHLAQAVRIAHLSLAETRLWTIFQQRQFWLDLTSAPPPPLYISPDQRTIIPRFATVTFNGKHLRPSLFARSADGRVCVTIVNPEEPGEMELPHFRVWRSNGTPMMPWQTVADAYEKEVRELDGAYLSDDGAFVAVLALAWRQPKYLEIWNTQTKKRVGRAIEATGRSPNHQNVGFGKVQFLSRPEPDGHGTSPLLLTASNRGDASLFEVMEDSYELLARCSHTADVTVAEIDDKKQWLMSASSDGEVRIYDVQHNKPVGHPFLAPQKAQSVQRSALDKLRIGLGENNGAEYQLSSLLTITLPVMPLRHTADGDWNDEIPEGGPNVLPSPTPGTVLTQSQDRVLVARSISSNEIAVVEAPKNGPERQQWSHRFAAPVFAARFESNDSRLVIQTSAFVTEIWDPSKNRRIGTPIDEARLFADNEIALRPLLSMLGARGDRLLTRSLFSDPAGPEHYWFTVWDVATGLPLTDRMHTGEGMDSTDVNHAELTDDQKMLLLGDVQRADKPAKCLQLDVPVDIIDLLPAAAEGLGGLKLEADGSFSPVKDRADKVNALLNCWFLARGAPASAREDH